VAGCSKKALFALLLTYSSTFMLLKQNHTAGHVMKKSHEAVSAILPVVLAVVMWGATIENAAAGTSVVNDFDDPAEVSSWTFSVGSTSPAASGQIVAGPEVRGGGGATVKYNLGCEVVTGGCYVRISRKFASPAAGTIFDAWIRCTACEPTFEVKDGTGQWLIYESVALPIAAKSLDSWQRVVLSLPKDILRYRAGANDGKFHSGIQEIRIIVKKDQLLGGNGILDVDEVRLHDTMGAAFAPEIALNVPLSEFEPPSPNMGPLTDVLKGVSAYDGILTGNLGFSAVRSTMLWEKVEKEVGTYNFTFYDNILRDIRLSGGRALFVLAYGHPTHTGGQPPRSDAEIEAFARFAAAAAAHYRGAPVDIEIWNEPSFPNFWSPSPSAEDYGKLLRRSISAIRSVDPSVTIVTGGMPGWGNWEPWPFLRELMRSRAVVGANALGIHPYTENKVGDPERRWRHLLRGRRVIQEEMGSQSLPLRITEWGFTTPPFDTNGDGHSVQSRHKHAVMVTRSFLTWLVIGEKHYFYYNLIDKCDDERDIDCNLGLLTFDLQEKPAARALKNLSSTLISRTYKGALRQSSTLPPWLNVARFDGGADMVFAVWLSAPNWNSKLRIPENGSARNMYGIPIAGGGSAVTLVYADGPVYVSVPKEP
jgi:hypothetical protein